MIELAKLVNKVLREQYPHLLNPSVLLAEVTSMQKVGERIWQYNLRPLHFDRADSDYPEIPGVKSHVEVEAGVGGLVAVALLSGQLRPVVIDEVIP